MEVNDYKENYSGGWISLYRSIQKHWIWNDEKYLKWWLIVLFEANHSVNKITLGYEIHEINKGQSANSLRTWSRLFDTNTKTVSRFFSLLEKDEMIIKKTIGKGKQSTTLVTISNYTQYQGRSETLKTTQGKRERDTNNKGNNENNKNIDEIYSLYPTKCIVQNRSLGKTSKNKDQIKTILKKMKPDVLTSIINRYISECKKDQVYMMNFKTFLNNLPDYSSEPIKKPIKPLVWEDYHKE